MGKSLFKYELWFKRFPNKVDISISKTLKDVQKDIKRLKKFGYKQAKHKPYLNTKEYLIHRIKIKGRKR